MRGCPLGKLTRFVPCAVDVLVYRVYSPFGQVLIAEGDCDLIASRSSPRSKLFYGVEPGSHYIGAYGDIERVLGVWSITPQIWVD